jgi:murein DD-endopeptidase MepM/ murein hydrolase activator NlpD
MWRRCRRGQVIGGPFLRRLGSSVLALSSLGSSGSAADCENGIHVRLASATPVQGGVSLLEIDAPPSAGEITVTWEGKPIPVWRESAGAPIRALLGVDVERKPGAAALVVKAAGSAPCSLDLDVRAGDFAVKELRVADRYVELNPRDLARAEREAARLEALFSEVRSERLWEGAFRLPLRSVAPSNNFGQRRILNGVPRNSHAGVDFPARSGTAVRATQRARVVLAEPLFFSGRTVVLDHGLGLFSFYGHLSAIAVRSGQKVEAGALIGKVGATGRATGPHLHWSVRLNKARVNPLELVAASGGPSAGR